MIQCSPIAMPRLSVSDERRKANSDLKMYANTDIMFLVIPLSHVGVIS